MGAGWIGIERERQKSFEDLRHPEQPDHGGNKADPGEQLVVAEGQPGCVMNTAQPDSSEKQANQECDESVQG